MERDNEDLMDRILDAKPDPGWAYYDLAKRLAEMLRQVEYDGGDCCPQCLLKAPWHVDACPLADLLDECRKARLLTGEVE